MPRSRGRTSPLLLAGVLCIASTGGCATGSQIANDPSDRCAQFRDGFRPTGEEYATSAATGAALGALAGALTGYAATGKGSGAATGALIGGGTGAVAGLVYARMNQQQRAQALAQRFSDAQGFLASADRARLAFDAALDCRRQQRREIIALDRQGRLPHAEAAARMVQVRTWMEGDIALARAFDQRLTARAEQLTEASDDIRPGAAQAEARSARATTHHVRHATTAHPREEDVIRATATSLTVREAFSSRVQTAEREVQEFQLGT